MGRMLPFSDDKTIMNVKKHKQTEENEVRVVSCEEFAEQLGLEIVYAGRGNMTIDSISVSRPGLQLAGYFQHFASDRVQVIGNAEHEFIKSLPLEKKERMFEKFFVDNLPCVVMARNLEVDEVLGETARRCSCPIFRSSAVTTVLIHDLMVYLNELLAPVTVMHAVMLDISGVGVLITGHAGVGKSETALELISRGHRLVADDTVIVKNNGEILVASCPKKIQYYMEVRGIGIINVKTMFGPGAIRPEKTVELVAELVHWNELSDIDRLGDEKASTEILGMTVPKLIIPVSPGRNIPIILETAARQFRLEELGYSAVDELLSKAFVKNEE